MIDAKISGKPLPDSSPYIILIVDDNPTNLGALFKFLTDARFKVLVAVDGESALEQIEYSKPDLILLDIMMPGIDGFETCSRLKKNPDTQNIPIIFMTALSDTVDKVKGFGLGAVDYITKPIQHEEVLSRINTHLMISFLQHQLQEKNQELMHLNENLEALVAEKTKQLIDQEKDAIIGRLIQGVIHNLRNPLQTILVMSDFIESRGQEIRDSEIIEYIEYIKEGGNRIKEITDNLAIRRSFDQNIKLQLINLNDLLHREIHLLDAHEQFKYKIKKEYHFDPTLPLVPVIYTNVAQVFHNLVNNAIDAMWQSSERQLTIITRQDQQRVYLDVQDTGCGIPPENYQRIFDIFYSSKPAKSLEQKLDEPTGTGLGLYTCLELLKPFKAEISFSSELGQGSIFTVGFWKQLNPFSVLD